MSPAVVEHLESKGVEFSLVEDCVGAMLRISTDKTINGSSNWNSARSARQMVWLTTRVGRSLSIVPRSGAKCGFIDANLDDYEDGSYFEHLQRVALAASPRTAVSRTTLAMVLTLTLIQVANASQ